MSVEVLIKAFEKAREELGSDKKTHLSTYLSDLLQEEYDYIIGERRLRDYYTHYKKSAPRDQPDLKPRLIECFCKYLGYENYAGYVVHKSGMAPERYGFAPDYRYSGYAGSGKMGGAEKRKRRRYQLKYWAIVFSLFTVSLTCIGLMKSEKECMVWVGDHYEKSVCDGEKREVALQVVFLENLRKIEVCDTTTFFKNNEPIIWYEKVGKRYEYFTYYGLHPVTGKTLKPINQAIIGLYVKPCKGENSKGE